MAVPRALGNRADSDIPLSPTSGIRRGQARAADWALRTASTPVLRNQGSGLQLAALVLTAHTSPGAACATADAGQVARS
ncbi:hypothetical protein ACWFR5_13970 [Streptomyces sp. NPDC055092]